MSGAAQVRLVVLFADELRTASRLIKLARESFDRTDITEHVRSAMLADAFFASEVALYHVHEQPDSPIVVADTPRPKQRAKLVDDAKGTEG